MTKQDCSSSLQSYFDDLLAEPEAPVNGASELARETLPSKALRPAPLAEPTVEELEILEQSKRERLQALLNSQPLAIASATVATPVPSTDIHTQTPIAAEPEPEPAPVAIPSPAAPALAPQVEQILDEPVAEPVADLAANTSEAEVDEVEQSSLSPFLEWHTNGRPQWAQNGFEALLFDVAGLTLAVPLIALGQIHPLTDELTPLFGQAKWLMGLLPTNTGNVRTVNTALFVMPERYDPAFEQSAKYVISIDGVPWGLAVDAIHQPMSLNPDDVKWRTERSKRPWLAGTVKSAMCALLDIPQMGRLLAQADANGNKL